MSHKVAWITGGSSGIGAATALRLAKEGWIVAVTGTSPGKIEILCDKDPKFLKSYPGDVTKPRNMIGLVDQIERDLGPIDLAILNAGISGLEPCDSFTHQNFKKLFETNVVGVGNCLEPILQRFLARGYGHIAITASVAGYRGLPQSLAYSATKAALINLAESLAIELHDTKIKVQVISPGFIRTPMTDKNTFSMPMLMEPDVAAEKLVAGLKSSRFEIIFPWAFCAGLKILQCFPHKPYIWLLSKLKKKSLSSEKEGKNNLDIK